MPDGPARARKSITIDILNSQLTLTLPPDFGDVEVTNVAWLEQLSGMVKAADILVIVLALVSVVLVAAAIWAIDRRKRAVALIALTIEALLLIAGIIAAYVGGPLAADIAAQKNLALILGFASELAGSLMGLLGAAALVVAVIGIARLFVRNRSAYLKQLREHIHDLPPYLLLPAAGGAALEVAAGPASADWRGIVSLVVGTIAMLLTAAIMPGVVIDNLSTLVFAVILLALINALMRPVILGAFASVSAVAVIVGTLIFQVLAFFLIDWLLPGFHLTGVIPAFFGPIVFALFNTILSAILNTDGEPTFYAQLVARWRAAGPTAS